MNNSPELLAAAGESDELEALFERANLFPKHTGLPFVVWISIGQYVQHDVRVEVSTGPKAIPSQMISVAVRPNVHVVQGTMTPADLALLARWIEVNRDVILRYWEGSIDTIDAMRTIQPVR